jgi:hypothetical protein
MLAMVWLAVEHLGRGVALGVRSLICRRVLTHAVMACLTREAWWVHVLPEIPTAVLTLVPYWAPTMRDGCACEVA